jgi:hypothetical protein
MRNPLSCSRHEIVFGPPGEFNMAVFLIILLVVALLLLINIRVHLYQNSTRLINLHHMDEKIRWQLITRWGP